MRSLKTLVLAGVVTIGATAVASAADLGPPPVAMPHPPMAHPIAESGGWYLRGDIGIGALDAQKFEYSDRPAGLAFTSKDFQQQIFGGIGVGYQFNSWLRFDVTGEIRGKTGFSVHDKYSIGGQNCGNLYGQPAAAVTCTNFGENANRGSVSSSVFLANAYLDLGTWSGLTPFVGVGIGMTKNTVHGVQDTGYATNQVTASTIPLIAPVGQSATTATYGTAANASKTNVAWALMAGVAYDVTPNYKVELGYRYLNLGKISTGNYTCAGGCAATYSLGAKTLDSHEFKIGMRWMLGGPSYAAAPAPMHYPAEPRVMKKF
ncbi:MAG: outer membrane protein [Beijerinckiaceae bacterium]